MANSVNATTKEYVAKFDEVLIRCNVLVTESETQILFKFRDGLRKDLRTELLARGVIELEKAYALVQDLDVITSNHAFRSHDQRAPVYRPSTSTKPNRSSTHPPHIEMTLLKGTEIKALKGNFSRLVPPLNATSVMDMGI